MYNFRILSSGYILYLQWEATLISYLSARVINIPFNDMKTLLDNTNYKIGVVFGSKMEDHFKFSNNPLWQRAWLERIDSINLKDLVGE